MIDGIPAKAKPRKRIAYGKFKMEDPTKMK